MRGPRFLAGVLTAISCGGTNPSAENPPETPPAGAQIFFPKQEPKGIASGSPARGRLVVDGEDCLRAGAGATVPVWPPSYGLDTGGDTPRVLDANGAAVARFGEETTLGGGGIGDDMVRGRVGDRTARKLLERCEGNYFVVQEE